VCVYVCVPPQRPLPHCVCRHAPCSALQCVAARCGVLQCVAVCRPAFAVTSVAACCSVLQHATACCSVLQLVVVCCSVLRCICRHECRSVLQRVALCCCSVLQHVVVRCSVLQCAALRLPSRVTASTCECHRPSRTTHYNTLQHTATQTGTPVRRRAVCCSVLQCVVEYCSVLQCVASSSISQLKSRDSRSRCSIIIPLR